MGADAVKRGNLVISETIALAVLLIEAEEEFLGPALSNGVDINAVNILMVMVAENKGEIGLVLNKDRDKLLNRALDIHYGIRIFFAFNFLADAIVTAEYDNVGLVGLKHIINILKHLLAGGIAVLRIRQVHDGEFAVLIESENAVCVIGIGADGKCRAHCDAKSEDD